MSGKSSPPSRAPGFFLIATALASVVLLALHPSDSGGTFADIVRGEAANQARNAVVHGGYIGLLVVELACLALFSIRLGFDKAMTVAGLTFFAAGSAALSVSLLIDGLVIPAIAVKCLASPPHGLETAKVLFLLCGTLIRFLMPLGLLLQWAAVASWGAALAQAGLRIAAGVCVVLSIGVVALLAAPADFPAAIGQLAIIAAIALLPLWQILAGVLIARRTI